MHQGTPTVGEVNAVTITRDMLRLYGQHAFTVVGTSALIQGVALVVSFLAFNAFGVFGLLVWVVGLVVASQLSMGVYTKLLLHLRHGHEMPSAGYLIKEATPHLLPLIWLGILVGLGTMIGFIFLIAPGIYLALRWAVAAPALVAQRTSAVEAMRLSGEATQGHKGTVFALVVITYFFTNGLPQIIQRGNPTMAMENIFIAQALIATFATPIVALATAELFLRLAGVPDRIVPGMPLGGPAPAPAGPFVPTAAIPAQQAPSPYVPQPAPAAGFAPAPAHAAFAPAPAHPGFAPAQAAGFAPAQAQAAGFAPTAAHAYAAPPAHPPHHAPHPGFAPQPAAAQAYAPPAQPAPQHYAPPQHPGAPQQHGHPAPIASQPYAPPMPQHAAPAAPHPAAPQAYVPPAPPQHVAHPTAIAQPSPVAPQPVASHGIVPAAPPIAPQAYIPPAPMGAPEMRQGPSIAPPGLG